MASLVWAMLKRVEGSVGGVVNGSPVVRAAENFGDNERG